MEIRKLTIASSHREEMIRIDREIERELGEAGAGEGICTIFVPHTSAAVTINENADPDVPSDLIRALRALVPPVRFDHVEGNSDAHLLSSLIGASVSVPFSEGSLRLGRWQGVYFVELDGPRSRTVELYF